MKSVIGPYLRVPCPFFISSVLFCSYQAASQPGKVVYRRFCDDLEAVFTTHEMEKRPHFKPEQWHPQPAHLINELTPEAMIEYNNCMMRLANRVS